MGQEKVYIQILTESLLKKEACLERLLELTKEQGRLIDNLTTSSERNISTETMEQFNQILDKKQVILDEIQILDSGFESIYLTKAKEIMQKDKESLKEQIIQMQDYIKMATDKAISLEILERRNKAKFDLYLSQSKQKINAIKQNKQSVANYYKNSPYQHQGQSYFIDKKK